MTARCPFGDPACPCADGDPCHYRALPGSPAMGPPPVFRAALRVAEILTGAGIGILTPDEYHLTVRETKRWLACLDVARELTEAKP